MLRVTRLRPGAGSYYLGPPERSAVLGGERAGPSAGRWLGPSAASLGLTGAVGPEELRAVLDGRNPVTGRPLTVRRGAIAGYDLTFAAPKSASIAFGLSRPAVSAAVADAHDRAVTAAIGYVGAHGLSARRTAGSERWLTTVDGPVAAAFAHAVSRDLDPHLHTHVVVANVVHGADGRWTALDGRGLYAHARAAGAVYDAALRHELRAGLGLSWAPRRAGTYELAVVDAGLIGAFSNRQAAIRGELGGRRSARARQVAWAMTRQPKAAIDVAPAALRARWWDRADGAALDREGLAELARGSTGPAVADSPAGASVDEHRFAAALCGTSHATATRRDVVAAWAGALSDGAPGVEVARCVDAVAEWGPAVGVAEPPRAVRGLVPAPHLLRALGPRPAAPERLAVWQHAASAIEAYRARWSVRERVPLGVDGSPATLATLPARRLADHLRVERQVADARRWLGRDHLREPAERELARGRA